MDIAKNELESVYIVAMNAEDLCRQYIESGKLDAETFMDLCGAISTLKARIVSTDISERLQELGSAIRSGDEELRIA